MFITPHMSISYSGEGVRVLLISHDVAANVSDTQMALVLSIIIYTHTCFTLLPFVKIHYEQTVKNF
jgi:hypothetical protein